MRAGRIRDCRVFIALLSCISMHAATIHERIANKRIKSIIITGNKHIPAAALRVGIPFKEGELLSADADQTLKDVARNTIKAMYTKFKRLRNITIGWEPADDEAITIHIIVEEKKPLKEVKFQGNTHLSEKEIAKKIVFAEITAIDEEEIPKFSRVIAKLYAEKGYHQAVITPSVETDADGRLTVTFTVDEKQRAIVKRIQFLGNKQLTGKQLRAALFTKEDWILGFMDNAGTFHHERVDADRYMIEQLYQNNGFLHAKVIDTQIITDPDTNNITIIHEINEGDQYTIGDVEVSSDSELINLAFVKAMIPVQPGEIYAREKVTESIKAIENLWADVGYLFAHVEPAIQPNDETKKVNIAFHIDAGKQVMLNNLHIRGNKKTRDKVIRRNIILEEGDVITNARMEASKSRVESMGYFDQREGVNWKITRLNEDTADLDLIVKEIKTGSANVKLSFGGSPRNIQSSSTGVQVEGVVSDSNIAGSGIRGNITTRFSNDEKAFLINLTQPWLFDKPIYGSFDIFHKRTAYEELRFTSPVNEVHTGSIITTGFLLGGSNPTFSDIFVRFGTNLDNTRYEKPPHAVIQEVEAKNAYDKLLNIYFDPGTFATFNAHAGQDRRNHPIHPSRGHMWLVRNQACFSAMHSNLGFYKFDVDANWYTPLIGFNDLVLRLHGYLGLVKVFFGKTIPYRELFHIGGPASVRGYIYGQIGPQFVPNAAQQIGDSIGGSKTFFVNAELIFPITPDFNMKGLFFYDGGAGWDNPFAHCIPQQFVKNNTFDYRHAVGFGLRVLNPMPLRIDWGFKLDPRKGEPAYKVDFGMSYDW